MFFQKQLNGFAQIHVQEFENYYILLPEYNFLRSFILKIIDENAGNQCFSIKIVVFLPKV